MRSVLFSFVIFCVLGLICGSHVSVDVSVDSNHNVAESHHNHHNNHAESAEVDAAAAAAATVDVDWSGRYQLCFPPVKPITPLPADEASQPHITCGETNPLKGCCAFTELTVSKSKIKNKNPNIINYEISGLLGDSSNPTPSKLGSSCSKVSSNAVQTLKKVKVDTDPVYPTPGPHYYYELDFTYKFSVPRGASSVTLQNKYKLTLSKGGILESKSISGKCDGHPLSSMRFSNVDVVQIVTFEGPVF